MPQPSGTQAPSSQTSGQEAVYVHSLTGAVLTHGQDAVVSVVGVGPTATRSV